MSHRPGLISSVARSVWRGALYKVNFAVTGFCNSKCLTCDIWKTYPFAGDRDAKELTLEEIERFFAKLPDSVSWLSLTGGEPFSRKDFTQIVEAAIARIPDLHLIGIPNNGLLPDRVTAFMERFVGKPHP